MTQTKEMTKAEKVEVLKCFAECYQDENKKICENCPYTDFCWDLGKLVDKKAEKYI